MSKQKTTRLRSKAAEHPVPQSKDECVAQIAAIGHHQRERQRLEAAMNDELAAVRQRWEEQARPHADAILSLSRGVQTFCEAHRAELTRDGKVKTYTFASGEVRWRMPPPSVSIRGAEAVIESLERLGLVQYLRTRTEVNKEAILADPGQALAIKGITICQEEDFVVVPWDTQLEAVA